MEFVKYLRGAFAPFFILVFSITPNLSAQNPSNLFKGELYIGGLLSQVAGDGFSGYRKLGWNIELGVSVDKKLDSAAFYFGIGIRRMGAFQPVNLETGQMNKFNYTLDYFSLPFRYQFWKFGVRFQAGISFLRLYSGSKEFNDILSDSDNYRNWQLTADLISGFEVSKRFRWNLFLHQSIVPIENIASSNGFYWERGGLAMTIGTGLEILL
jgi:hypothetical protein